MNDAERELTTSDQALVEQTRRGNQRAFAELWRRHYRSGARVARQVTSSIDADDLVSESYTRIYQRVLAGGGPTGAFRPYLYTTIRNLASTWGAANRDVQVDDIADFEDPMTLDDPAALALDRTLTARAFKSLPERWQSVLWYTEVEGMDPHEVAPLLGISANSVAALSYRAREGLRKAWLQAHISDAAASSECQWALSKLGDHARRSLPHRDSERMSLHLLECTKCAIISEEVDEVGSRLALVLLPIMLGGVAGGAYLASFGSAASASTSTSAAASAVPAMPGAVGAGSVVTSSGIFGAATAPVALAGGLALVVALSGTVLVAAPTPTAQESSSGYTASDPDVTGTGASGGVESTVPIATPDPVSPTAIPGVGGTVDEALGGLEELVGSVLDGPANDPIVVAVSLNLIGTGTPGAYLSLQAAGLVYATTRVDANGAFALSASGIPGDLSGLQLVQTVDHGYLQSLLGGGGLLGGLLGTVDALIKPLHLSSGGSGSPSITLVN
ncbi:MAG: sigma-70 family RNA polymerase sigma factor [Rhodoglobus sp.]